MKKRVTKTTAVLLALIMLISAITITATVSAAAEDDATTIYPGGSVIFEVRAPEMELGALSSQVYYDTSLAEVSNMYIYDFAGADSPSIAPYSNYVYGQNNVFPEEHVAEGTVVFSVTFTVTSEATLNDVITGSSDIMLIDEETEVRDLSNGVTISVRVLDYGTPPADPVIIGDVNGDKNVDVLDAAMIQKYAAGKSTLTPEQIHTGDVNGDNNADVLDATEIQKFAAGKITEFKKKA